MPSAVRSALTAMARSAGEREICGFIMRDWAIHVMRNVSDRNDQFVMDDKDLLDFFGKNYYYIEGVYHSHWDGQKHPSDKDVVYMQPHWRYWIVTLENVHEWELKNGELREVPA